MYRYSHICKSPNTFVAWNVFEHVFRNTFWILFVWMHSFMCCWTHVWFLPFGFATRFPWTYFPANIRFLFRLMVAILLISPFTFFSIMCSVLFTICVCRRLKHPGKLWWLLRWHKFQKYGSLGHNCFRRSLTLAFIVFRGLVMTRWTFLLISFLRCLLGHRVPFLCKSRTWSEPP